MATFEAQTGTVTAVIAGAGGALDSCNVGVTGFDDFRGVALGAFPNTQEGDRVTIAGLGNTYWIVNNSTRLPVDLPPIPELVYGNPADLPAGSVQLGTAYQLPAPRFGLFLVYSTPPTPPPTPASTVTVNPVKSSTYDNLNHWGDSNDVRQGAYPDSGIAASIGCYVYDLSGLAGQTITAVSLHMQRRGRGGDGQSIALRLGLFTGAIGGGTPTVTQAGLGPELTTLQVADIDLPANWGQMLIDAAVAGVCISSATRPDYLICDGAGDAPRQRPNGPVLAPGALTFTL